MEIVSVSDWRTSPMGVSGIPGSTRCVQAGHKMPCLLSGKGRQRGLQNKRLDISKPSINKRSSYDDKQTLLVVLKTDPFALEFASEDLRADRDVVECAVSEAGMTLQFASPSLQEDRSLVLRAVSTNVHALQFVSPTLRADEGFALQLMEHNVVALFHMPEFLARLGDRAVAEKAMLRNAKCFKMLPEIWRDDEMFAEQAILQDGLALQHASERLRSSKALALLAVSRNGEALEYVFGDCKKDIDVVVCAVMQTCYALKHVPVEEHWPSALLRLIRDQMTFKKLPQAGKLDKGDINFNAWQEIIHANKLPRS
eukprot:TRINITY_DN8461_c0_g1_i3.p1 TRINITY_DN8461_c0_g1~~TRINITY_DN8461_c0_g1_i3.p1  ORF type:complete len:336 (-),score=51.56 TRINITY_DN8461_c0_g1_i3:268-1203(-)